MIPDPIQLKSQSHWNLIAKDNIGKYVFIKNQSSDTLMYLKIIACFCDSSKKYDIVADSIFSIYKWPNERGWNYSVGGKKVSKDQFLFLLEKSHPEYAEWLLFNKEWLD